MSSLWFRIEKQLQLCLKFEGPNVLRLSNTRTNNNSDLLAKVEHVEKHRSSLKLYL
jgi:hypothetical protein